MLSLKTITEIIKRYQMQTQMKLIISFLITTLMFVWMACDPGNPISGSGDPKTCEGCHTNKELLKTYIQDSSERISPKITGAT